MTNNAGLAVRAIALGALPHKTAIFYNVMLMPSSPSPYQESKRFIKLSFLPFPQCLSMSTSFCYGCLYAARKEVQGVGLTWSAMWEESSPGDSMSLGLILLTIAFDGFLYAVIGYLVARYTNSGRKTLKLGLAYQLLEFLVESIFQLRLVEVSRA